MYFICFKQSFNFIRAFTVIDKKIITGILLTFSGAHVAKRAEETVGSDVAPCLAC